MMSFITIEPVEKTILMQYMLQPLDYVEEQYHCYFPQNTCLEHTKITRGLTDAEHLSRYFLVPLNLSDATFISVPFSHVAQHDSLKHSCTFVGNKYFFHQNEDDLPKVRNNKIASTCESDNSSSESEDEHEYLTKIEQKDASIKHEQRLRFKAHFRELRATRALDKNYLRNQPASNLIRNVVKYAVDEEGFDYILKSSSSSQGYIPLQSFIINRPNHFRFYRNTAIGSHAQIKCIDIKPYYGNNLSDFLAGYNGPKCIISSIIYEMLAQYIQQIYKEKLVHTDINPSNICIQRVNSKIQVHYIDDEEAFLIDSDISQRSGRGTAGYYAPEFFIASESYQHQLDLREHSECALVTALKPNFKNIFSQATDIYAVGRCILNCFRLYEGAPFYELVQQMCSMNPNSRPTGDEIENTLSHLTLNTGHQEQCTNLTF